MDENLQKILDAATKSSKSNVVDKYGLIDSSKDNFELDPNDPMVMMFEKMLAADEAKQSETSQEKDVEKEKTN